MNKLGEKSLKTLEYYEILEKTGRTGGIAGGKGEMPCASSAGRPRAGRAVAAADHGREGPDGSAGQPCLWRHPRGRRDPVPRGPRRHTQPARAAGCRKPFGRPRAVPCCTMPSTKPRPRSRLFSVCSPATATWRNPHDRHISEEEIADGASPELLSIRRELRRVSGKVRETLNRMISGERSKYLQENIITQRNGRFVVPGQGGAPR